MPELRALGHDAVAVDLPCDDVAAGLGRYADTVIAAIEHLPPAAVVLVGHSLGGLTIPAVADRAAVASMIFLCALIPTPGQPFADRSQPPVELPPHLRRDRVGRTVWSDTGAAADLLYSGCDPKTAVGSVGQLRPQADAPLFERSPFAVWPSVPSAAIVCRDDAIFPLEEARAHCRERLGIEPLELEGSHSPFLSRPAQLARMLVAATGMCEFRKE